MDPFLEELKSLILNIVTQRSKGVLREMVTYHLGEPGKLLRPQMVKNLSSTFKIDARDALNWASCLELFHNATLIHDDIQDGDLTRRGQSSLWAKYGKKQALNAGDFMMMLAHTPLFYIKDPEKRSKLQMIFTESCARIVQGQSLEFQLNELDETLPLRRTYFECISYKTAELFSCLAHGIAVLAELPENELHELTELFRDLGIIFQLQDDILDLYGDKQRNERGCDLKEGKVSYLIIKHLETYPSEFEHTRNLLRKTRAETSQSEVEWMSITFIKNGVLSSALQELQSLCDTTQLRPIIAKHPELAALVKKLLHKILVPIAHLQKSSTEEIRA